MFLSVRAIILFSGVLAQACVQAHACPPPGLTSLKIGQITDQLCSEEFTALEPVVTHIFGLGGESRDEFDGAVVDALELVKAINTIDGAGGDRDAALKMSGTAISESDTVRFSVRITMLATAFTSDEISTWCKEKTKEALTGGVSDAPIISVIDDSLRCGLG